MMWGSKSNEASPRNQEQMQSRDTKRDVASAWDTVHQTKAALRHIENRLEAVPTSTAVLDTVMDTKKSLGSATRKVSRKDGRYVEDSVGSTSAGKSNSRNKLRKDKMSRSPLRSTTLESNIKKSNQVEFRDPLASYRYVEKELDDSIPSYLTASQLEAQRLLSNLTSSEAHETESETHQMIYGRDNRSYHCLDNDSTRSSVVDDTVVKFLNDQLALDALHNSALYKTLSHDALGQMGDGIKGFHTKAVSYDVNAKNERPSEQSQLSSPSSTSESMMQRLEIMRRKQHDDKLEKLKERIRKQRGHSEESIEKDRHLNFHELPAALGVGTAVPTAKVRKIAIAPPAPSYKGFNPTETKIRTPDGKVWCEDEIHNMSKDLYREFTLQLADSSKTKEAACEKAREKKTVKPVRKVQKMTRSPSPDTKPSAHVISTASWREGQKLVKMVLGPAPKTINENKVDTDSKVRRDRNATPINAVRVDPEHGLEASRKSRPASCESRSAKQPLGDEWRKEEGQDKLEVLNTHVLPAEVREILDDLQLEEARKDSADLESGKRTTEGRAFSRSVSPTKRKQEKSSMSTEMQLKRLRHYDAEEVRQFIARQQTERKKRQTEEKKAQKEAMEQKNKRLQELYRKQKEAFSKSRPEPVCQKYLQETFTKCVTELAKFNEPPPNQSVPEEKQPKTIYQPSGESDKENKGQDRPLSASSSSDMSLSESRQAPGRREHLELSWIPSQQVNSTAHAAHPSTEGNLFSHLLNLEPRSMFSSDYETIAKKKDAAPKGQAPSLLCSHSGFPSYDHTAAGPKAAVPYKSKIDRIEALKATAASLSNRIENEAKKLAGAGINYGIMQDSEHDVLQTTWDDRHWSKLASPPVRDGGGDDASSRIWRIQGPNMGHTAFVDQLPGAGNLYECKKLSEVPQSDNFSAKRPEKCHEVSWENAYKRSLEALEQNLQKLGQDRKQFDSPNSSGGSISEGPLLSEGSLSEEDCQPSSRDPTKLTQRLKNKDFCAEVSNPSQPVAEFQKEAERYQPLQLQLEGHKSKAPWEELAKGSPHSVINIFTKTYQFCGRGGLEEQSDKGSPTLQPLVSATRPEEVDVYEDDFLSSQSSTGVSRRLPSYQSCTSSPSSVCEELPSKRSRVRRPEEVSPRSPVHRSTPSSRSSSSSRKKMKIDGTDVAGSVPHSPVDNTTWASASISDQVSTEGRILGLGQSVVSDPEQVKDLNDTTEETPIVSPVSVQVETLKPKKAVSSSSLRSATSTVSQKPLPNDTTTAAGDGTKQIVTADYAPSSSYRTHFPDNNMAGVRPVSSSAAAPMFSSPLALHHRMSAELAYLDAIEDSVRQLTEVEKIRGIALAQQESVSLAQILKAQQQRHEHDFALLKLKTEQETVASQKQLEETRQKTAQAHAESLLQFAQTRQEMLQESTNRMMVQQVEAAKLTVDTARQIKEMTELAYVQIATGSPTAVTTNLSHGAVTAPVPMLLDQQRQQHSEFMKQMQAKTESEGRSDTRPSSVGPMEKSHDSKIHYSASLDSLSDSSRYKQHDKSGGSSRQDSPSFPSEKGAESRTSHGEKGGSSIEEEVHTAADDSIQSGSVRSFPDDKDSASIATEYSLKFDESMTEDEIEEKSFRSLLPSESHRRFNMERKRSRQDDSDEETARDQSALTAVKHDLSMPFSGGQDSFSKFTMEMVRQYMKEEEMRAQHQVSLLKLRERALKEKTKAELAWLEHQKKRLRDKGEDDKMPPIRKRQRGLLLRLQQEQAEIKRLQEATRAARKERQLILKQQEEIQRLRHTTIKIQEKLKSAGESKLELRNTEHVEEVNDSKANRASSPLQTDVETRSPSPISISGSETSSIMQKLKKMRSHMDEKHCSPVHYFFSVFTSHHWASLSVCFPNLHPKFQLYIYNQLVRFLTKREQKLMHRRRHAEELLEWKRRLDAEEAEIRRMEKLALAAWNKELKPKATKREANERSPGSKDTASEDECSAPSPSRLHSDSSIPYEVGSPPAQTVESASAVLRTSTSPEHSVFTDDGYSHDFESVAAQSKQSAPSKTSVSASKQDGKKSNSSLSLQIRSEVKSRQASCSWSDESVSMTQSETASDQSDIEGRIHALKDELRKRKSIVDKLKKEQKKRQKERLKAQEASLIKQLESYDEFIKKTQAELSKDLSSSTKPQIKTPSSIAAEKPKIKPLSLQRTESAKSWKSLTEGERSKVSVGSIVKQEQRLLSPDGHKSSSLEELHASDKSKSLFFDSRPDDSSQSASSISISQKRSQLDNVPVLFVHQKREAEFSHLPDQTVIRSEGGSGEETVVSNHPSLQDDVQEELENMKLAEFEKDVFLALSQQTDKSAPLLKLDDKKPQPFCISEFIQKLAQEKDLSKDAKQPFQVEQNLEDLKDEKLYKEDYSDREDETSDDLANSLKFIKSIKSDIHDESAKSDRGVLDKTLSKNDSRPQELDCLSPGKEAIYSEDLESSRKRTTEDLSENSHIGSSRDDIESAVILTSRNEITHNENVIELQVLSYLDHSKQKEGDGRAEHSQSASPIISTDDEISEHLSEKSFSSCGSGHSEKLLDLKSGIQSRNVEHSDAETEVQTPVPSRTPSPCHTPTPTSHEIDELSEFQIGDRVLVSSIQPGTLCFKGRTHFADGFWAGVELDVPEGSGNGTYDGVVYFKCKDKCGIFAPPNKISVLLKCYSESINTDEIKEGLLLEDVLDHDCKHSEEEGRPLLQEALKQQEYVFYPDKTTTDQVDLKMTQSVNILSDQVTSHNFPESNAINLILNISESIKAGDSLVDRNLESLSKLGKEEQQPNFKDQDKEESITADVSIKKSSQTVLEKDTDIVTDFYVHSSSETKGELSPIHEKPSTPLLDLLNKEKEQLEAQLRVPSLHSESEEIYVSEGLIVEESKTILQDNEDFKEIEQKDKERKASSLTADILSSFLKDAVKQLQQIKKVRDEKIQVTNQELWCTSAEESSPRSSPKYLEVQNVTGVQLHTAETDDNDEDKEEILSPDLCPRPGSPVFGTSGQEELTKRLAELELSRELLDDLGDEQDWFEEDFGLSSRKVQQPGPELEPQLTKAVALKVHEEQHLSVPHDALEVEKLVHAAAEELWKWQELAHDLWDFQLPQDYFGNNKGQDVESVSRRVYCEAVFNLTREIFSEIFAEDPNVRQPPWMKSSRNSSTYFRRVKNPQDISEVKTFISNEVLKLFGISKEQDHKTDWQKMMKFGRKKRDRVDHILVQELHEEEAQWVNYDEDELCVKMQLADGIFDALIKDTINVLNQIHEKRSKLTPS
ncbi:centrosome-associated protein 350 isoform X4 [Amblyraja radiata]|uniref:centrosome-associated protein 350 isoform X4 n=1 Tax=Amblyraja radiata TaxID=386614 RepID=UPI0014041451|nr:centrosome-associated protein 350 isoform X4 [Amblyraja radiata]